MSEEITEKLERYSQNAGTYGDYTLNCVMQEAKAEILALRAKVERMMDNALRMIDACPKHTAEIKKMGFNEFVEHDPKTCRFCLREQLAEARQLLRGGVEMCKYAEHTTRKYCVVQMSSGWIQDVNAFLDPPSDDAKKMSTDERHDWQCGCGHWNGCNLTVCAVCGRSPGEKEAEK